MADELKEFSNHTAKTLTELTTGVTLASTDANKKAVIKGIAVENPNGRSVEVRLNSKTGTKIAGASATQTLSGHEILDNSQSLVACTDSELVLNRFDVVGWYEGRLNVGNATDAYEFNSRRHHIMSHASPKGPMFTPDSWDMTHHTSPNAVVAYPKITDTTNTGGYFLEENISDSFFDKFGNMFFWGAGEHGDTRYQSTTGGSSTTIDHQVLHRIRPGLMSGHLTTYGNGSDHRIMFYDGSRYIYTGKNGETRLRKYDTHTMGTNNTFTDLNLYASNSGSTALTLSLEPRAAGCYYHSSGFAAIYGKGGSSSDDGGSFRIVDLATGRTKALYDKFRNYNSVNGYANNNNARRSLALVENTKGELWAVIGNWGSQSNSTTAENGWSLTNLGTDPAACLADSGTFVDTMFFDTHTLAGQDSQWNNYIRQKSAGDGAYFGNPRGFFAHTPNVKRYLTLIGNKYQRQDTVNTYSKFRLDFDNPRNEWGWFEHISGAYKAGCYRAVYDTNEAESGFGTVNFRTTGIEVT